MEGLHLFALAIVCPLLSLAATHDPRIGGVDLVPIESEHGRCLSTDGSRHDVGISWFYPDVCRKFVCVQKGDEFFVEISHCKDISSHPDGERENCEYTQRMGIFPRCCPAYVCKAVTPTPE